jgi:hypothetical protein
MKATRFVSRRSAPTTRRTALTVGALLCVIGGTTPARSGPHPCLLISPDDVARLQHVCGVPTAAAPEAGALRAGGRAVEFQELRAYFAGRIDAGILPGEVTAAAFLHMVDPSDRLDWARVAIVTNALSDPEFLLDGLLEAVIALDWCFDVVPPEARRSFVTLLTQRAGPLTAADSPLEHRAFRDQLALLAAASAFDEQDIPGALWAETRQRVLATGREYLETTLPAFVQGRGRAPTSPTAGPAEEHDTALLLELGRILLERDLWPEQRESVGRWLEHYVYGSFVHPALQHSFIRDDGNSAPLTPAPRWDGLLPVTAHLIAARTLDPAAAFIARRVEQRLRGPAAEPRAKPWLWVPIVFEISAIERCDYGRLPLARNFGGAVAFRAAGAAAETGIWIEAGQPHLRQRQHYDAGHFLIYAGGGQLTVDAGDDIMFEATPGKSGRQRLGNQARPFDFEQFNTATIAHNCLLLWDPLMVQRWQGQRYEPIGGQRPVTGTCTDFARLAQDRDRQTGRMLAYGERHDTAYLALDLQPAYDRRSAAHYTREFIFLAPRALLVIDRVKPAGPTVTPVWIVNVPARPSADGGDLPPKARVAGATNEAGVWRVDQAGALRWSDRDGALNMIPLLPAQRHLRVVGGPAQRATIAEGPFAGRGYLGSSATGFERRVRPFGHIEPDNAWYELGQPTLLGPTFGRTPLWGRIELEPAAQQEAHIFVTLLVVEAADAMVPADAAARLVDEQVHISLDIDGQRIAIQLPGDLAIGGSVSRLDAETFTLPATVEPDPPLPTN